MVPSVTACTAPNDLVAWCRASTGPACVAGSAGVAALGGMSPAACASSCGVPPGAGGPSAGSGADARVGGAAVGPPGPADPDEGISPSRPSPAVTARSLLSLGGVAPIRKKPAGGCLKDNVLYS